MCDKYCSRFRSQDYFKADSYFWPKFDLIILLIILKRKDKAKEHD